MRLIRHVLFSDHTRLSVWVLDGDPSHAHLLRFALSEESFPHTLVMFVVAMTTPWGILDQLQTWATVLQDHIDRLKIDVDDLQEARHKCKYYVFIIFLSLLSLYFECHFV